MMNISEQNLIGKKFGRLTIVSIIEKIPRIMQSTNKQNGYKYKVACLCDCGNTCEVFYSDIKRKHKQSCGCLKKETTIARNKELFSSRNGETVGEYKRLYHIYIGMLRRCYQPNCKQYIDYGGRGIYVCDDWLNENGYSNFKKWAISHNYKDNLEIDRINNNKEYSPQNCRWASRKEQMRNTRRTKLITFNGETKSLSSWCEELGLNYYRVLNRLNNGFTIEQSFSEEKYVICHPNIVNKRKIVADGMVFNSIAEFCNEYLHQTTGSISQYLSGTKKMPQKWQNRGLRYYDENLDTELPFWK